ncbi:MAG: hypothetical protein IPP94_14495 [Ignavibacteria bacterium]|nr:hypothetical protein [Ignavibacteria bacterium]
MQKFETLSLILFLCAYLLTAIRAIATPAQYKEAELRFYKTGKPGSFDLLFFALSSAAFAMLLVHFITEVPKLGQLVLYVQIIMTELTIPLNFISFLRDRTKNTLNKKTSADYRNAGLRKFAIAAVMLILPFVVPY